MSKAFSTRGYAMITVAVFIFMLIASPFDASAGEKRWRSKHDELPGLGSATPLIILAATAGIVAAVVLVSNAGKDKQKEEGKEEEKKKDEDQEKAVLFDSSQASHLNYRCSIDPAALSLQERLVQTQEGVSSFPYAAPSPIRVFY